MSMHPTTTDRHRRIRPLRHLLLVAGAMAALTVLAPTVSATPAGHPGRTVHIEKICNAAGDFCTVTRSNYRPIRAGSTISYAGSFEALVATIHAKHGTATGDCDITPVLAGTGPGQCVFTSGTGSLRHIDFTFAVNLLDFYPDETSLWSWDATVTHGHGPHH